MGLVTLPFTLTPGTPENVSHVQANDEALRDELNGSLDENNLAAGAVTYLKTATGSSGLAVGLLRATMSADQLLSVSTTSKVTFNTEALDVSGWFDNATNYRFTPQLAGYYRLTASLGWAASAAGSVADPVTRISKNGSSYQEWVGQSANSTGITVGGAVVVQANGTSDYFEVYAQRGTGDAGGVKSNRSYFEAELIGRA